MHKRIKVEENLHPQIKSKIRELMNPNNRVLTKLTPPKLPEKTVNTKTISENGDSQIKSLDKITAKNIGSPSKGQTGKKFRSKSRSKPRKKEILKPTHVEQIASIEAEHQSEVVEELKSKIKMGTKITSVIVDETIQKVIDPPPKPPKTSKKQTNPLNDLDGKEWLKFTKSWFSLNPKPRDDQEKLHPSKFPEELAASFIMFFTKKGETVLDPFAGTASTLVAAEELDREALGFELSRYWAEIGKKRIKRSQLMIGDARELINELADNSVDFIFTSPPYWQMLGEKGDYQQAARRNAELPTDYDHVDIEADFGSINDYEEFIYSLDFFFRACYRVLRDECYLCVIIQNIRRGSTMQTLAWDLAQRLRELYHFKGERIWVQDDKPLRPYGMGSRSWVPTISHHYCLIFQKKEKRT